MRKSILAGGLLFIAMSLTSCSTQASVDALVEKKVQEYIEAHREELKGDKGDTGMQGIQGVAGKDGKLKPRNNPNNVPEFLNEVNKKYFNLVKEHQKAGLPIWIRTKYRADDTEYKLVKAEADEYKLTIQNEKAFIGCRKANYAHNVKVTNLDKKYFFTEEEGLKSLK